jgi:Spy/CpxP family protein refolding chaperone
MKHLPIAIAFLAAFIHSGCASQAPYSGEQARDIKALSAEDTDALLKGKGMGLAKAAELNGYPGPLHVLELASDLKLDEEQRARTKALFDAMQAKAVALGVELVAEERRLDALFAQKSVSAESLAAVLARIGDLQAKVRGAHLEAHIAQAQILTPGQSARYVELRGYSSGGQSGHRH